MITVIINVIMIILLLLEIVQYKKLEKRHNETIRQAIILIDLVNKNLK